MSMADAIRSAGARIFQAKPEEGAGPAPKADLVAEYAELVRLAQQRGRLDRDSATWMAVSAMAAREILEVRARMDVNANEIQTAAMRARVKAFRDLLRFDEAEGKRQIRVEDHGPEIP
jgi:gamma-glutamyl:cysteine ligase YbdK (ATP-grasp superfamily)